MRLWFVLISGILLMLAAACSANNGNKQNTGAGMPMNDHGAPAQGQMSGATGPLATGAAARPIPGATTLTVTLSEYAVQLDAATAPAGPVHLVVRNTGQRGHQLQIYPLGAASGAGHGMQMGQGGAVKGAVGLLPLVPIGETTVLDVTLPAGAWELGCHLSDSENGKSFDHYDRGMKVKLIVV